MESTKKSWEIFPEYVNVMNDYLNHFTGSEKFKKRDRDGNYLLMNGFITLSHVFKIMLNAKPVQAKPDQAKPDQAKPVHALENMEKSIYYYTEFIEQMEENFLYDLNVSSNNASRFVYKKTIANLLPTEPVQNDITNKNIARLLRIYQYIFEDLLDTEPTYSAALPTKLINVAIELCRSNQDETLFQSELKCLELFLEHFPSNIDKYEYIYLYIKKYKQTAVTLESLCRKKAHILYADKLKNESPNNYIKWILT